MRRLDRDFFRRSSLDVATELLNKVLVRGPRQGRIVEVEAYCGANDPGSHAYRGQTPRTRTMFGPPGHLYVYFIYGMHWCANAVCGDDGEGTAVLIRALAPIAGLDEMRQARPKARRELDLCSGPAKLCQSFGITGDDDGADLIDGGDLVICDDGTAPPADPGQSTRIGLSAGADLPWRWVVRGDPNLSKPG